jgi:hypothetical protein
LSKTNGTEEHEEAYIKASANETKNQSDSKNSSLSQNYTEVGIDEPEKVKNIQLSDNGVKLSLNTTTEYLNHVNVTNRTDYSEKVINDVAKAVLKNKTLSLAQVSFNTSLSQNYSEEKTPHEGDFDDRNDPTKRNHSAAETEEEEEEKPIEVHEKTEDFSKKDVNLTLSLSAK